MEKAGLLEKSSQLVKDLKGTEQLNQIKLAFNYLLRTRDLEKFQNFLEASHASKRVNRHWEFAAKKIKELVCSHSIEDLLYILGWAHRLRKCRNWL